MANESQSRRSPQETAAYVDELERELFRARNTIIELAPPEHRDALAGLYSCRSRDDVNKWRSQLVETIVSSFADDQRVQCPLCKESTQSGAGFLVQGGLRRHLTGEGPRAQECGVMYAARRMAQDCADNPLPQPHLQPGRKSP